MTDRALTLTGLEVCAVLAGKKTHHRVLLTPRNSSFGSAPRLFWEHANFDQAWVDGQPSSGQYLHVPCHRGDSEELDRLDVVWAAKGVADHGYRRQYPDCGPCEECDSMGWRMTAHRLWPNVIPGDRLWVKEGWRWFGRERSTGELEGGFEYRADGTKKIFKDFKIDPATAWDRFVDQSDCYLNRWRSAANLPRWASRLTFNVKATRIHQLQEITEADARSEGMEPCFKMFPCITSDQRLTNGERVTDSPTRASYAFSWDGGQGKKASWLTNPWVLAMTLEVAP